MCHHWEGWSLRMKKPLDSFSFSHVSIPTFIRWRKTACHTLRRRGFKSSAPVSSPSPVLIIVFTLSTQFYHAESGIETWTGEQSPWSLLMFSSLRHPVPPTRCGAQADGGTASNKSSRSTIVWCYKCASLNGITCNPQPTNSPRFSYACIKPPGLFDFVSVLL